MDSQYIDPEQQKAIEQALMQKYKQASDTSGVNDAIDNQRSAGLISGLGQALETAARAGSMSRGGPGVNTEIYKGIQQRGNQEVQNATAQRQMAIDQAMKNIDLNRQGNADSMAAGNYNQGIDTHKLGMQKGAQDLAMGEKSLAAADQKARKSDQDFTLGQQQVKAGNISVGNLAENQDPKSNVSQLKQQLAATLVPGKDFTTFSGAQLDATIPELKDMYDKQAAIQIEKMKSSPSIAGNKSTDEAFAKDYVDYVANGGAAAVKQNLSKVQEVSDALGKPGNKISGSVSAAIADKFGLKEFTNPESVATEQKLRAAVLPTLKTIFPRLTEVEVNEAISTAYNPKLSPEVNKANVDKFLERLKTEADAKESASNYFQDHKTLNGFKGKIPGSVELSGPTNLPPTGNAPLSDSEQKELDGLRAKYGK